MPPEILYTVSFSLGGMILIFGSRWYLAGHKLNDLPLLFGRVILYGAMVSITLLFIIMAIPDMPSELPMSFLAGYGGALLVFGILWFKRSGRLIELPPFLGAIAFTGTTYSIVLLGLSIALKLSFAVQFILSLLFNAQFKYSSTYKDHFNKKSGSMAPEKSQSLGGSS